MDDFARVHKAGRMPHAILLTGAQGIGKRELARDIAAMALEVDADNGARQLFEAGTHPDFFHLAPTEDKTIISVEQARQLSGRLALTALRGHGKAAVIAPAEAMNREAANALLKTLEEPPGGCVMILVSHNPGALPMTIRSRCRRVALQKPGREAALGWLRPLLGESSNQAETLLALADGAPLRALVFHEQGLAATHRELLRDLQALHDGTGVTPSIAAKWSGADPVILIAWLQRLASQAVRLKMTGRAGDNQAQADELKHLKISWPAISLTRIFEYLALLQRARREADANLNRELFLERIFIHWQALKAPVTR